MDKTCLQEMRKKAGYKSAKDFAEYMGIAVPTYTGYEQGRTFTLEQAWEFADELNCSLDELAGREWPVSNNESPPYDPTLEAIKDAYISMNGKGRTALGIVAKSMSKDPENQKTKSQVSASQVA